MKTTPRSMRTYLVLFNGLVLCISFALTFFALDWYLRQRNQETIDHDLETYLILLLADLETSPDSNTWQPVVSRFGFAHGFSNAFFQVLHPNGNAHVSSDVSQWPSDLSPQINLNRLEAFTFHWETHTSATHELRMIYYRINDAHILRVGLNTLRYSQRLHHTRLIFLFGALLTIALVGGLSWINTRRAIRAVEHVTRKALEIRQSDTVNQRVALPTGLRETDELASTFNDMMHRIRFLMDHLKTTMDHFAHDLKTPITRMRGLGEEAVRKGQVELEFAAVVVEESDRIHQLLEGLLEVTSAEAGVYPWRWQSFDLAEMMRDASELFAPLIEAKALRFSLEAPPQLMLHNDPKVCQRIIGNILENAIKYTEQGSIQLTLHKTTTGAEIICKDTGIGIAPADREQIFAPFYRADRSRSASGHGLGLSFCHTILQAMGGAISCQSQVGAGTRFEIQIPEITRPSNAAAQ